MKENIIFVFPGQGAQYVGMGKDLFDNFAVARYTFEYVSDLSQRNMRQICFSGSGIQLNRPENASLATFVLSMSILRVLEDECGCPVQNLVGAVAGHSVGQYAALCCAGSIGFKDAVSVLAAPSHYASLASTGMAGMIAVVGLPIDVIKSLLCESQQYGYAEIANYNAHDQFVISGQDTALNVISDIAKSKGARLVRRLNVAVPAHCGLMVPAAVMSRKKLNRINVSAPKVIWFSNQTASPMTDPVQIKESLVDQVTCGVRWAEIMDKFPEYKITRAYELGPGRVLSRLIGRANVGVCAMNTDTLPNVRSVISDLICNINRSR